MTTPQQPTQPHPEPGEYVEAGLNDLDDGEFRKRFDDALRELFRGLVAYEKATGETDKAAELTVKLKLKRNTDKYFEITDSITRKLPSRKSQTLARAAEDRLLTPAESNSLNDHDQLQMRFDRFGRPAGAINPATGEVVDPAAEESGTAGRISGA